MNLDYCLEQIQEMESQVAQMQQLAGKSPLPQQQQLETMAATFQKLRNAWEEVQVATEELHQQNEQLRQVNDRFQLAASAVNCLIYDWDVENKTVDRTQGIFELLGYRTEEAEPTLDWWLQRIHPDDRQRIRQEISDALACHSSFTTEYRMRHKDNQYLYIWERGLIIRNATGQAVRVVGSNYNITPRKQAEVALERLNEELENRVRERTAQLEQKNQQLKVEIAQRARAEASLRQREQEFRALAENAPDIIARFDRELRHLYVNPASEQASGRPPQELIGKTHRELGMPEANVSLWEQVIRKIFETGQKANAIKYSPGGRTVQFNLTSLDDKVVFQIQDHGIGIPPEDQPRLFEAFHRATNVGPIQGTGLGLTLVKQCVDLHRGEITFTSVVGEGTTFTVTLPLSNETPL